MWLLQGYKEALSLMMLNNIGILYKDQIRLDDARKMYMRAPQGYKETFYLKYMLMIDRILQDLDR